MNKNDILKKIKNTRLDYSEVKVFKECRVLFDKIHIDNLNSIISEYAK